MRKINQSRRARDQGPRARVLDKGAHSKNSRQFPEPNFHNWRPHVAPSAHPGTQMWTAQGV